MLMILCLIPQNPGGTCHQPSVSHTFSDRVKGAEHCIHCSSHSTRHEACVRNRTHIQSGLYPYALLKVERYARCIP